MNCLGYLALLFSVLCLFLPRPWPLVFAIAAACCGLLSATLRHWEQVRTAADSFAAKVAIAVVAGAALFCSPWIANSVLSEIALLRPSAFPAAYSAFQYIAVLLLWAVLAYLALVVVALFKLRQIFRRAEVFASLGRLAGMLVLLLYLAPMFLHAANYDSGGVLSRIVVATSFVENRGQSIGISSLAPDFPEDCKMLAKQANLDMTKSYSCVARTIRCSNINPDAQIAFLDDKGAIAVAKNLERTDILFELVPVRFDLDQCDQDGRYDIRVEQKH